MTSFKTRKKDGQVFPTDRKSSRDSGNPSYVGVDKSQIESVSVFKEKGKITGGEIDIRKGKEIIGKKLNVVSRTQGGVVLKARSNKIDSVSIFKEKGKKITGGEVDLKKGKEIVAKRLSVTSRLQGGVILKVKNPKLTAKDKQMEKRIQKKYGSTDKQIQESIRKKAESYQKYKPKRKSVSKKKKTGSIFNELSV